MTETLCEACRRRPIEALVADDDARQPYRVCSDCAMRLRALALRPLEWFNLAAIHSPTKHLLHDDFYTDNGVAQQPDEEVLKSEEFPAPTLDVARHDLERLVDYAMTRYSLDAEAVQALSQHDPQALLSTLRRRVEECNGNPEVEAWAYEVAQRTLGPIAEEWVRARWSTVRPQTFISLAGATASCLPFSEGFARVTAVLEDQDFRAGFQQDKWGDSLTAYALAPFRSRRTLNWMEAHSSLLERHHDVWGRVAALSHFSWPRAADWLGQGRPLSHIALYAILGCLYHDTALLREHHPTLEEPETTEAMLQRLDDYYEADHVPRVRRLVESIRTLI